MSYDISPNLLNIFCRRLLLPNVPYTVTNFSFNCYLQFGAQIFKVYFVSRSANTFSRRWTEHIVPHQAILMVNMHETFVFLKHSWCTQYIFVYLLFEILRWKLLSLFSLISVGAFCRSWTTYVVRHQDKLIKYLLKMFASATHFWYFW